MSVAYQKPYTFEMPDKLPSGALLPPPHCGVCNRPISKIQIICTPDGASIAVRCHGYNAGKFSFIESLTAQGPNAIYQQMLEAFSNKGGFQKSKGFEGWKAIDDPRDKYKFDPDEGRKSFDDVAKRAREEIMKDDRWKIKDPKWKEVSFRSDDLEFDPKFKFPTKDMRTIMQEMQEQELLKQYAGPIYASNSSISSSSVPYSPDCRLCKNPVRVTSREDYSMRRHIVRFECHGRREEIIISDEELLYSGRELGGFIAIARPFLSDFKKLEGTEESPKQKPKPRTGLTITIGQERIINLE